MEKVSEFPPLPQKGATMFLDLLVLSIVALALLDGFVEEVTEYDDHLEHKPQ